MSIQKNKTDRKISGDEGIQTDSAISKAEKQIELLTEYRTALISEAVTGKIDVRGWSA